MSLSVIRGLGIVPFESTNTSTSHREESEISQFRSILVRFESKDLKNVPVAGHCVVGMSQSRYTGERKDD